MGRRKGGSVSEEGNEREESLGVRSGLAWMRTLMDLELMLVLDGDAVEQGAQIKRVDSLAGVGLVTRVPTSRRLRAHEPVERG